MLFGTKIRDETFNKIVGKFTLEYVERFTLDAHLHAKGKIFVVNAATFFQFKLSLEAQWVLIKIIKNEALIETARSSHEKEND